MDWKIIAISAGALLLAGLAMFLLSSATAPSCELQPPEGYIYGIGEGISADLNEARAAALENALSELSHKLITYVQSDKMLSKYVLVEETIEGRERVEGEALKVKISLKAALQIGRYKTKECSFEKDGKKHVKMLVYVHPAYARMLVNAYSYAKVIQAMAKRNMCFTGYEYVQKLKTISAALQPTPPFMSEVSEDMQKILECHSSASSILSKMKSMKLHTPEDFMEYVVALQNLKNISSEIPSLNEINEKIKNAPVRVGIQISGPEAVVKGQNLVLKVSVKPTPSGSYRFSVKSSGIKTENSIMVEDGEGIIEGNVLSSPCEVKIDLAGILKAEWKANVVYEKTPKGVINALLSLVSKPSKPLVFLPSNWDKADAIGVALMEKRAKQLGWNVKSVKDLSTLFDNVLLDLPENFPKVSFDVAFVHLEKEGASLSGSLKARISVDGFTPVVEERVDLLPFAKAAVMSGRWEILRDFDDPLIKGVAAFLAGQLDEAKKSFEKSHDPVSRLLLAKVFLEMGNYKKAVDVALSVKEDFPEKAFLIASDALAKIDEPLYLLEKMREIDQAVHAIKDCHAGYYAGARLLASFGNYKEAEKWILKALDIMPENPTYLIMYAKLLVKLGEKQMARKVIEKLEKMNLKPSLEKELEDLLKLLK